MLKSRALCSKTGELTRRAWQRWRQSGRLRFTVRFLLGITLLCAGFFSVVATSVSRHETQWQAEQALIKAFGPHPYTRVRVTPEWLKPFVPADRRHIFDHVVVLGLSGKSLADPALKNLSCCLDLRELYLRDNLISDQTLVNVGKLECLEVLCLTNNKQISNVGLSHLAENRNLRCLALGNTMVTAEGVAALRSLSTLERLHLGRTTTDDAGLKCLVEAKMLRVLDLAGTPITDAGLVHLLELRQLETLILSFTGVGDEGIVHLSQMNHLSDLYLKQTEITDTGLERLQRNLPGVEIFHSTVSQKSGSWFCPDPPIFGAAGRPRPGCCAF